MLYFWNQEGDELSLSQKSRQRGKTASKKAIYAQIGVRYYVVFDPLQQIQKQDEMNGAIVRVWSIAPEGYTELTAGAGLIEAGQSVWLSTVGLGLTLWEGLFEDDVPRLWLRWCDRDGQVIATGAERADDAEARVRRLAARLRALGEDPDLI